MGDTYLSARAGTARQADNLRGTTENGQFNRLNADNHGHMVDDLLVRIVEGEIIPRLMLAHKTPDAAPPQLAAQTRAPTDGELQEFTRLALTQDQTVIDSYVQAMLESGCGVDEILLDLLAPAARRLGEMWEADECNFVDVTIGLGHLHSALHHLGRKPRSRDQMKAPGKRALLATVPGEQHIFGILMVENFLRRAGWDVDGGIMTQSEAELIGLVKSQWFAVVGLSLSGHRLIEDAASAITAIRKNSHNKDVKILVGGHTFLEDPELVEKVGADMLARDGYEAVHLADKCLLESALLE